MKKFLHAAGGFCAGIANGLLGAGGGMIVVPLPYLPFMLIGSAIGAWALPKLNRTLLRRIFGGLMLWAAWRMLF